MKAATLGAIAHNDARLEAKANALDVCPSGAWEGVYSVASASQPGTWHQVDTRPSPWLCDCYGSGSLCSHKRATRRYLAQRGQYVSRGGAT